MANSRMTASALDFVASLTRDELVKINPAELYKIIEFSLVHEVCVVSADAPASQIREAVIEWCAGGFAEWDIIEQSPWFYDFRSEKSFVSRHVAQLRQKVAADRRRQAAEDLAAESSISDDLLRELFED
jgi:hypothetical protein